MHHRRFYFDVAPLIEKLSQLLNHSCAGRKYLARFFIGDEVEIALPVAQFHVRQAVPLLRQRQQRLGKEKDFLDPDGKLVGLGAKQVSAHTNRIAEIEKVEELEPVLPHNILFNVNLHALTGAEQVREARFPHEPKRNDAPSDAHFRFSGFELSRGAIAESFHQSGDCVRPTKLVGIGIEAQSLDLLELFLALVKLVARLKLQQKIPFHMECTASIAARGVTRQERRSPQERTNEDCEPRSTSEEVIIHCLQNRSNTRINDRN